MSVKIRVFFSAALVLSLTSCTNQTDQAEVETEAWRFTLQLGKDVLPFTAHVTAPQKPIRGVTIYNAEERIELSADYSSADTLILGFPVYPSRIVLKRESPELMTGYWEDFDRTDYRIPLIAERGKSFRFTPTKSTTKISERYKVHFGDNETGYYGVLEIENSKGRLTGTFLTETGDYRFSEGNIMNGKINLSTFDGSHAWLFDAVISGDSLIEGRFLSGTHYSETWYGVADSTFSLRRPTEISSVLPETNTFSFRLPNEKGDTISSQSLYTDNKVYIFQITGSWCPNCKDASLALHTLTSKYPAAEVAYIPIHFERYSDFNTAAARIRKMQDDLGLPQSYLFGGKASSTQTAKVLPDIDAVRAYPTIVITDRAGKAGKIFTGFYGPGTGTHHSALMEEIKRTIDSLVSEGGA